MDVFNATLNENAFAVISWNPVLLMGRNL